MSTEASNFLINQAMPSGYKIIAQGVGSIRHGTTIGILIPTVDYTGGNAYADVRSNISSQGTTISGTTYYLPFTAKGRLTSNTNLNISSTKVPGLEGSSHAECNYNWVIFNRITDV